MSRRRNLTPTYRFHKSTGQAVCDYYDPLTGIKRTISVGRWQSQESHKEHARICAEVANGRTGITSGLTMNELMVAYLRFAKEYYVKHGRTTQEVGCIKSAIKVVRENYGHVTVEEFGPIALETVQKKMIGRNWTRNTINKQITRVRRIVRWGVAKQLIPANVLVALQSLPPLKKGRSTAREKGPILPVPDAVVDQTLPHLLPPVATMVRLQRLAGMRPEEVTLMRPCDIDRTESVWVYTPSSHKMEHTGRDRQVPLGPKAQTILIPFLNRKPEQFLFSPAEAMEEQRTKLQAERIDTGGGSGGNRKPKSTSRRRIPREHYDTSSYRRSISRACKLHGIMPWAPNQLRHSAGTEIRKRYGLEYSRTVLGHAHMSTTEIYAERDHTMAAKIAAEMG